MLDYMLKPWNWLCETSSAVLVVDDALPTVFGRLGEHAALPYEEMVCDPCRLVPKEILSVARATSCTVFLTLPLLENVAASCGAGPRTAFGFLMVAFPAREHLSSR